MNDWVHIPINSTLYVGAQSFRLRMVKKDETVFYANLECIFIEERDGRPRQIRAVVQDVTHRKLAEDEIKKARREWEGIFHAVGHPALIMDMDHRLIHANKATEKATGRSEKDLMGKRCYEIFHNAHEPAEGCPFEKTITSGRLETVAMEMETLGGTFLVSCTPTRDEKGRIEKVIHIATDITDRKKTEEQLKESEKKYRDLVENINDVIFTLDTTGTVTYISPAIETIFGYRPSEVIGRPMREFIYPDDHAALTERYNELVLSGRLQPHKYRLMDKSGNIRWVRSSSRPMVQDGKISGVQGVMVDITHSERLEAQLRQAHKMEAIATLAGGISHDYNNLLSIIMGNLSLAREETEPHSVMGEFLHEAEQASAKAKDLTHEFMTLSRGGHPVKTKGSLAGLLKEIREQARSHEGIQIILSIRDDLRPVAYDARQMGFAINNLLVNAVEAMPRGGKITIQAENQVIMSPNKEFPWVQKGGPYVKISIKDEGGGIPEKHINRIFDPYFSTKEQGTQKGMGLGLTTAYAVVQKHGGHMVVNSKTGVGTTVTIYLPAECVESKAPDAQGDDVGAQSTIANQQSTIRKILVMDDEESLRNLARKMLERLGYEVETANEGVEALQKYQKHMDSGEPFDAVLLDLSIKGGMGGEQAVKELIKIDPHVRAIVCSAYFNAPVMADYGEYGFRGVIEKPYQKADLERVLKKVLG